MTVRAAAESHDILRRLGVPEAAFAETGLATRSPVDGSSGPVVAAADAAAIEAAIARSARSCAPRNPTSPGSSPSKPARSSPRASARFRR